MALKSSRSFVSVVLLTGGIVLAGLPLHAQETREADPAAIAAENDLQTRESAGPGNFVPTTTSKEPRRKQARAAPIGDPLDRVANRINNRIENRIDSRIGRGRIERSAGTAAYERAAIRARRVGLPRTR